MMTGIEQLLALFMVALQPGCTSAGRLLFFKAPSFEGAFFLSKKPFYYPLLHLLDDNNL